MFSKNRIIRGAIVAILIPSLLSACSTYHLREHNPQYVLSKQAEATKDLCAVAPFSYEPIDQGDSKMMNKADLDKWNELFFEAFNRADICGRAIRIASLDSIPAGTKFVIDGKVTEFSFERNWVPMFFPVWMGLTVLSLGIYGLAAGPMTTTKSEFGFTVNLKSAKTRQLIESNAEKFDSTDVQTLYSDDAGNPYNNPGLAFEPTLNEAMKKLSTGIARASGGDQSLSPREQSIKQLGELRDKGVLSNEEYAKKVDEIVK
jgi:hypothetical protein